MYCGIGDKQLEVLNTETNRNLVILKLMSEFKAKGNWSDDVLCKASHLLGIKTLFNLLRMNGDDVEANIRESSTDFLIDKIGTQYPVIKRLWYSDPVLPADEGYDEVNNILAKVLPTDTESLVKWECSWPECSEVMDTRLHKYLPEECFVKEKHKIKVEVNFAMAEGVIFEVDDPDNLTSEEKDKIVEMAVKQMREKPNTFLNADNFIDADLYEIDGDGFIDPVYGIIEA